MFGMAVTQKWGFELGLFYEEYDGALDWETYGYRVNNLYFLPATPWIQSYGSIGFGLMHEEIESCLRVVISAVSGSRDVSEWALEMLRCDRSGFLCEQELRQLAGASRNVQ